MVLAVDVHYSEDCARAIGILFEWEDCEPTQIITEYIQNVEEYVSGQFYRRELPCILKIITKVDMSNVETIVIDGHIYVDNAQSYGLGGYLYEATENKKPIIGIAKKAFYKTEKVSFPVYRGSSQKPLFVSSVGIDALITQQLVKNMCGKYRIPTVLKILDSLTKIQE